MTEFEKASARVRRRHAEWGVSETVSERRPLVPTHVQFRSTRSIGREMNDAIDRVVDKEALSRLKKARTR